MEVIVAKTAGFCFGVKRAVDEVYNQIRTGRKPVYTYGPIIHNQQVVDELSAKGVKVIRSEEELSHIHEGTIIIRSHGVPKKIQELMEKSGADVVDATCPFVKKIHHIAEEAGKHGDVLIIVGDPDHPEVQGIMGWTDGEVHVVRDADEMEKLELKPGSHAVIVSQTTYNKRKFEELVDIFMKKEYICNVNNTVCSATDKRQTEAREIASKVDAMVVIGGRHSSNTQKLYQICSEECTHTYFIETLVDLDMKPFQSFSRVGITAGASTPKSIIEEVTLMSEEMNVEENDFEKMLNESFKTVHNGEVVEGTVIDVKPDQAILNIGTKADGILTRNEYSNDNSLDLTTVIHVGDKMEVKVMKMNDSEGQTLVTYKRLAAEKGNKRLEEAFENGEVLKAKVVRVLNGGLSVNVEGARVFIPASLVSDTYEKDLNKYMDQEIEFKVIEFNPRRRRIIGDRKQLVVAEKKKAQEELFSRIHVGDVVEGTVKNITDFGAFIDLGGADGLLHISEMSWGRVDNPRSIVSVGDKIKVLIKDIKGDRIALSLKFEDQNPWLTAADKYAAGTIVTGKVARMTDFGAFVELEPGIDALLHVSQISREHVNKPSDVLSVGQEITAKIVDFNAQDRKISLSMKALENDREADEPMQRLEVPADALAGQDDKDE